MSQGLETTAETDSVLRPRPASRRGDEGLKSLAAKLSNQGSTGVKPAGAELRLGRVVVVKPGLYRHRAGRGRIAVGSGCNQSAHDSIMSPRYR